MSAKKRFATDTKAWWGQGWKKSMAVQLIKPGNRRARILKTSPTGEKASTNLKRWRNF